MPQTARKTSNVLALPFFGNGQYVLGLVREKSNPERACREHEAFIALIEDYASAIVHDHLSAVRNFYRREERPELTPDFNVDDNITFRVDGRFITDIPEVRARWHNRSADHQARVMQCLVCGEQRPVLDRLEGKLKGVPGGQTSGTSLISANAEAFESYGLEASLIAPICEECADGFTKAVNELLGSERNSIRLGGAAFVFWTREPVQFDFRSYMDDPQPEQVRALIESPGAGRPAASVVNARERFYATVLSGSGGRAVVREWVDVTVDEAQQALRRWFDRQTVVDAASGKPRYFSIRALAGATVRDLRDVPPQVSRSLLRTALTGTPIPLDVLDASIRRTRAEQRVTAAHAALIKLVLASQPERTKEEQMVELQQEHTSAGYQCGRLLSVLESVQRAALPGIKAGIVDRFYGSASSSPGGVFPRLVRGAQPHLGKLERDRPAAHAALQARLGEVLGRIAAFPKVLALEEQGLFALGYYHQRSADRARARDAAERRRAGAASITDQRDAALGEALSEDGA
jgi:CRISPR-associated protein Csd1